MQTHTLIIPDRLGGGSVEIRAKRGWGAAQRIESAGVVIRPGADGDEHTAVVDGQAKGLAILEGSIVSWTLPLPATRAGFLSDDFDPDVGDWLVDACEEYYASLRRTEEESKTEAAPSMAS
jgi:hypothetical protein